MKITNCILKERVKFCITIQSGKSKSCTAQKEMEIKINDNKVRIFFLLFSCVIRTLRNAEQKIRVDMRRRR
jgi:hypothetical protein